MRQIGLFIVLMAFVVMGCGSSSDGSGGGGGGGGNTTDLGGGGGGNTGQDGYVRPDPGPGPKDVPETGRLHGWACTKDDQCRYGTCYDAPNITHGAFKICTKDCNEPSNGSCYNDDTDTVHFTSLRWGTFHPEETIHCYCVPKCETVSDCKQIDPRYNACQRTYTGTWKVCQYIPPQQ